MWLSDQCVSTEWPPAHQMTSMWPLFFHQYKKKNVFTEQVLKLQINNMHVPKVCGSISRYITQLSWKTEPARQSPKKHCPRNICESTNPTVSPLQKPPGLLPTTMYMFSFPQVLPLLNKFSHSDLLWTSVSYFIKGNKDLDQTGQALPAKLSI